MEEPMYKHAGRFVGNRSFIHKYVPFCLVIVYQVRMMRRIKKVVRIVHECNSVKYAGKKLFGAANAYAVLFKREGSGVWSLALAHGDPGLKNRWEDQSGNYECEPKNAALPPH